MKYENRPFHRWQNSEINVNNYVQGNVLEILRNLSLPNECTQRKNVVSLYRLAVVSYSLLKQRLIWKTKLVFTHTGDQKSALCFLRPSRTEFWIKKNRHHPTNNRIVHTHRRTHVDIFIFFLFLLFLQRMHEIRLKAFLRIINYSTVCVAFCLIFGVSILYRTVH